MEALPLRLEAGVELRAALERAVAERDCQAAFVISGIGSLRPARVRFAGAAEPQAFDEDLEMLSLAGTVSRDGSHLHCSIADAAGRVYGGHVAHGCVVRTTAEVLLILLRDWHFVRKQDPQTGFAELVVQRAR